MKIFQQNLDGTEQIIIHFVNNQWEVAGVNDVYYSDEPNDIIRQIEDRYPLTKETLPILIEEIKQLLEDKTEV